MLASEIYHQATGKKWHNGLTKMLDLLEEAGINPVRTFRNGRGRSVELASVDEKKFSVFLKSGRPCNGNGHSNGHSSDSVAVNDLLLRELVSTTKEMAQTLIRIEALWRT